MAPSVKKQIDFSNVLLTPRGRKRKRVILKKPTLGLLPSGNAFLSFSSSAGLVNREASLGDLSCLDDSTLLSFLSSLSFFLPLPSLLSLSCVSKHLLAALLDEDLWQALFLSRWDCPYTSTHQRKLGEEEITNTSLEDTSAISPTSALSACVNTPATSVPPPTDTWSQLPSPSPSSPPCASPCSSPPVPCMTLMSTSSPSSSSLSPNHLQSSSFSSSLAPRSSQRPFSSSSSQDLDSLPSSQSSSALSPDARGDLCSSCSSSTPSQVAERKETKLNITRSQIEGPEEGPGDKQLSSSSPICWTWRGSWKRTYIETEKERTRRDRSRSRERDIHLSNTSAVAVLEASCSLEEKEDRQKKRLDILRGVCSDVFYQRWLCAAVDLESVVGRHDNIPRVAASELSVEDFIERYEKPNKPVVLTGVVEKWPAFSKWTKSFFLQFHADRRCAAGAASDLPLKTFYSYAEKNHDEAPLFIFDPKFGDDPDKEEEGREEEKNLSSSSLSPDANLSSKPGDGGGGEEEKREKPANGGCRKGGDTELADSRRSLLDDYEVPSYFSEKRDLFTTLGDQRPNFRWLLIGYKRSGSKWHIDPNQTSAWNAVIRGKKRWILLPPHLPPPGVFPSRDGSEVTQPVSLIEWYLNYYDLLHEPGYPYTEGVAPLEGTVREGEIVFIPQGWWHCVLNEEDDTIAITQNYVSETSLPSVRAFLHYQKQNISGVSEGFREAFADAFDSAVCTAHPSLRPLVALPPPLPRLLTRDDKKSLPSSSCVNHRKEKEETHPSSREIKTGGPNPTRSLEEKGDEESYDKKKKRDLVEDEREVGKPLRESEEKESGGFWHRFKKQRREPLIIASSQKATHPEKEERKVST